jgi:hypothetical protein
VKDSEVTPVGTTQLWPRPAVEKVTVQLVTTHTGVGEAATGELVAKIAVPSTPTTENAAVAIRPKCRCSLGCMIPALDSRMGWSAAEKYLSTLDARGAAVWELKNPAWRGVYETRHGLNRSM